ncbi:hypothetical protein [Cysteiniphilum marinum]|uniref:hypothetical protein n=1 Tax=Cysteiniphilum marinum TaxID=2774191 RepID=UPI00193B1B2B|nr:hypothetical protein [Cysteiniphilum marinum]
MAYLPDKLIENFNKISTVPMNDFYFWIKTCGIAFMLVVSLLIVVQTIVQLKDSQEITNFTAIAVLVSLIIALSVFIAFFNI